MIDSHCHLDDGLFDGDRDAALARAAARGVAAIVLPAVGEASWAPLLALTEPAASPRCYAALGLHPVSLPASDAAQDEARLARLATVLTEARGDGRVVAVGECGLDDTIDLAAAPMLRQTRVLLAQLELARAHALPVILHARGFHAYVALLELLERGVLPARGGVLHSYGGGVELLRRFAALPLCFGFAGPATYPNARKVRASIAAVPDDRLLAETDAPDQTPEPHRPGRSEPAYVAEVIAGLAAVRQRPVEEIARLTTHNARRLFQL